MSETRYKDRNWTVVLNSDGKTISRDNVQLALQMDIRDELRLLTGEMCKLNKLLHCSNFVEIPHILRKIRANTTKPRTPK